MRMYCYSDSSSYATVVIDESKSPMPTTCYYESFPSCSIAELNACHDVKCDADDSACVFNVNVLRLFFPFMTDDILAFNDYVAWLLLPHNDCYRC